MRAAVALAALLNLAAAERSITASPESRTTLTASVTIREEPTSVWWDEDFTETGAAAETTSVVLEEDPAVSFSSAETTTVMVIEDPTASPSPGTTMVIVTKDPSVSGPAPETTTATVNDDPTAPFPPRTSTTTVVLNENPPPTPPPSAPTTIVVLNTEPTPVSTDSEEWTEPGNPWTTRSTTLPVLHPYIHYDFGIGTAWPRGTTKPECTRWTRVGDTHNRWTQDVYTATVTTTLLHKCGACAIVWTTPHKGYAWAKVYDSSTAGYPFTVTEVACRPPKLDGGDYVLPPHTPTDPWSTKTKTQEFMSTIYVTYPDRGPSTITPRGITSPACTSSTLVYGGGAIRVNKQVKWKFSTERTVTKDCGTCALAWSTRYYWQNVKGDFYHYYTITDEAYVATTLECGRAVPTEAWGRPRTATAAVTSTLTLTLTPLLRAHTD